MGSLGYLLGLIPGGGGLIFQPPTPKTYSLSGFGQDLKLTAIRLPGRTLPKTFEVHRLKTRKGGSIVMAFVPYTPPGSGAAGGLQGFGSAGAFSRPALVPTLLFSHGTAVDLGRVLSFYSEVAKDLRCNLCAYDYTGYGESGGTPSTCDTLADISAVFAWLRERGVPPGEVVLYGQSLGSGPSVDLASRTPSIGGLVLHAAFASGMQNRLPGSKWPSWFDIYPNSELIQKVAAPVTILHGTEDWVVPLAAGKLLHSLAKKPFSPYWAPGCSHDNVELSAGYVPHLRRFLQHIFGSDYGK